MGSTNRTTVILSVCFMAALIVAPGARADVAQSLSRGEEALKQGKTDEAVSHLLDAIRSQQEIIQRMQSEGSQQEELIQEQKESLDNLKEKVANQEDVIAEQKKKIKTYEEKANRYEDKVPASIAAVEEVQKIQDLYRLAHETRRTGIFDVRRRDAEPYFRKAVKQFQYIADTYPESRQAPDAQYQVAKTYHRWLDDTDQAIEAYRLVVKNWPTSDYANEAREALSELGVPAGEADRTE
jgi:TolA-binding protein